MFYHFSYYLWHLNEIRYFVVVRIVTFPYDFTLVHYYCYALSL